MKRYFVFAVIVALILGNTFPIVSATALSSDCSDVEFIFARGSGEHLGDVSYSAWHDNIIAQVQGLDLKYDFYELGSQSYGGYQYPATAVSGGVGEFFTLLGAFVSSGDSFKFGASVEQGVGELKAYLSQASRACPTTKYVLGGYSQGAMIMSGTLPRLDASKIIYVTTFGDPKLYLPEGAPSPTMFRSPDACRGVNISPYRKYVPDCHAYEGVLGSYRPYQTVSYSGKIGTWCNKKDIMCSSGLNISNHTEYISDNLYEDAAKTIRNKLIVALLLTPAEKEQLDKFHDLVFLFDTTGSMASTLNRYREEAKSLAEQVYDEGGRVALYEYRDLQDGYEPVQACDFSCTESELNQQLDNITVSGGGDNAESLLSGALTAMNGLNWREGATKSLVVLTDAPFHSPDIDGVTIQQVANRSLEIDPVNIYIIGPSKYHAEYDQLTSLTNGGTFNSSSEIQLSSEKIFNRPVAKLNLLEYSGYVGEKFTYDASASYGFGEDKLTYDWDLDGDGTFEISNGSAQVSKTYATTFDGYIQVRVSDELGSSTMSAKVIVSSASRQQLPQITNPQATLLDKQTAKITFTSNVEHALLSLNGLPTGTITVNNGQGEITLGDLAGAVEVTLIPYSETLGKGTAQTIIVDPREPQTSPTISSSPTKNPEPTAVLKTPDTGSYCFVGRELKCQ